MLRYRVKARSMVTAYDIRSPEDSGSRNTKRFRERQTEIQTETQRKRFRKRDRQTNRLRKRYRQKQKDIKRQKILVPHLLGILS